MKDLLLYLTDLTAACLQSITLVRFILIPMSSAMSVTFATDQRKENEIEPKSDEQEEEKELVIETENKTTRTRRFVATSASDKILLVQQKETSANIHNSNQRKCCYIKTDNLTIAS